jgi:hypothetical protein
VGAGNYRCMKVRFKSTTPISRASWHFWEVPFRKPSSANRGASGRSRLHDWLKVREEKSR